jgi:archaemetzincin
MLFSCMDKKPIDSTTQELRFLDTLAVLDQKIGNPGQNDWLTAHEEPGQSFEKYVASKPPRPSSTRQFFYLQPLGSFPIWQEQVIKNLGEYLSYFYGMPVKINPVITDPWYPAELERYTSDGRKQLLTYYILDSVLLPQLPADAAIFMGITNRDLYTGENNNYVFGQGTLHQRTAIASMFRLMGEQEDAALCLERIMKTTTHEAGHVLGMWHCTHAICLMNGSNSVEELDRRPVHLCSVCIKKAYWNLQGSFASRFKNLAKFYTQHSMIQEAEYTLQSQQLLQIQ